MANFSENLHPNSKYKTFDDVLKAVRVSQNCWVWMDVKDKLGYGRAGRRGYAHRVVYEALNGTLPKELTLDHLCRNTSCVNPEHLEPVLHKENVLRGVGPTARNSKKTHCWRGHEFTLENTKIKKTGRECRMCIVINNQRTETKRKAGYYKKEMNHA